MSRQYRLILPLMIMSSVVLARPGTSQAPMNMELSRIIAVCAAPVEFGNDMQQVAFDISDGTQLDGLAQSRSGIELVKTGNRYEIRYEDRVLGPRGTVNASGEQRPIHLVLSGEEGPEHFMFMINAKGTGELLWSTASVSTLTPCTPAPAS